MNWWTDLDCPDFEADTSGNFPRTGQVVKYYRKKTKKDGKRMTQKDLADELGITELAVWNIENKDAELTRNRREVLCNLLKIPPALFGIQTIEEIREMHGGNAMRSVQPRITDTPKNEGTIDVAEHKDYLARGWDAHFVKSTASAKLPEVMRRARLVMKRLETAGHDEWIQLHGLLCDYQQFAGVLSKDLQMYPEAIDHLNKAVLCAKLLDDSEMIALSLHTKGQILFDLRRTDEAMDAYRQAGQHERNLPACLKFALCVGGGLVQAQWAGIHHDHAAANVAIRRIDVAGNIVRQAQDTTSPYHNDFSIECYHSVKSIAMVEAGWNKSGINELNQLDSSTWPRRRGRNHIWQAQAYLNMGQFDMAASYAESGLTIVKSINSQLNIARVRDIHSQMQSTTYAKHRDTKRLGYLLQTK